MLGTFGIWILMTCFHFTQSMSINHANQNLQKLSSLTDKTGKMKSFSTSISSLKNCIRTPNWWLLQSLHQMQRSNLTKTTDGWCFTCVLFSLQNKNRPQPEKSNGQGSSLLFMASAGKEVNRMKKIFNA